MYRKFLKLYMKLYIIPITTTYINIYHILNVIICNYYVLCMFYHTIPIVICYIISIYHGFHEAVLTTIYLRLHDSDYQIITMITMIRIDVSRAHCSYTYIYAAHGWIWMGYLFVFDAMQHNSITKWKVHRSFVNDQQS